jgi:Holin of 3TMs, for gene-transfer release
MTQSPDPWTTRARPTFLYVIYIMILWSIPMSIIAALFPDIAQRMTTGIAAYLAAIPEPMWALFGTGYIGYTAARSWGKAKGVEK